MHKYYSLLRIKTILKISLVFLLEQKLKSVENIEKKISTGLWHVGLCLCMNIKLYLANASKKMFIKLSKPSEL